MDAVLVEREIVICFINVIILRAFLLTHFFKRALLIFNLTTVISQRVTFSKNMVFILSTLYVVVFTISPVSAHIAL